MNEEEREALVAARMDEARQAVERQTTADVLAALSAVAPIEVATVIRYTLPTPVRMVERWTDNPVELVSIEVRVERQGGDDEESRDGWTSITGMAYSLNAKGKRDQRQTRPSRVRLPDDLIAPLLLQGMTRH